MHIILFCLFLAILKGPDWAEDWRKLRDLRRNGIIGDQGHRCLWPKQSKRLIRTYDIRPALAKWHFNPDAIASGQESFTVDCAKWIEHNCPVR